MQVLLVEDEPAIADAVLYALESEGVACVWASTGEAALRHVRDSAPQDGALGHWPTRHQWP